MPPTSFTEGAHDWACLVSEAPGTRSRENLTIAQSGAERTVEAGRLLGRIRGAVATPVAFTAAAGDGRNNTGNGVFAADPTAGAGAKDGTYKLVCIGAGATAAFGLWDPDGKLVGIGNVGTAFASQLSFTLQDGGTDFAAGDGFKIVVAAGTTYSEWDEDATNGTEIPRAILGPTIVVPAAADVVAACLVRDAEVNAAEVGVPASGTTANEKAAALVQLRDATGIVAR